MEYIIAFLGMYVNMYKVQYSECKMLKGVNINLLSMCYQHIDAQVNRALKVYKLNMTQMSILTYFSRMPDQYSTTVSELSRAMEMNQPMVTKAVKHLVEQSWIVKEVDDHDARVSHLSLSRLGDERLNQAQQACMPFIDKMFNDFNDNELSELFNLLSKLKQNL